MTSTERLLAVHRGRLPDRVPVSTYELVGWDEKAWENLEPSYARLMQFIRDRTDCLYMTGVGVANVRESGQDVTVEHWDEGDQHVTRRTVHAAGRSLVCVRSFADNVKTTWTREHPVKDLDDLRAYLALPWEPGEPDFSRLGRAWKDLSVGSGTPGNARGTAASAVDRPGCPPLGPIAPAEGGGITAEGGCATFTAEGGCATFVPTRGLPLVSTGDPICQLAEAFEFGNFMVHAMTETAAIVAACDQLHQRYRERLRRVLTGPVANVVFRICGPEYATPPYLPPELFRKLVTRYDTEYVRMIQQAGGFARIHCHGKIARVIDQIAEMAPDALDPIEPPPDGDIDVAGLKRAVGDRLCLTGGIELKHLEHASADQVAEIVRVTMDMGKPGGRFVIMPTAAPISIPLAGHTEANYMRFIETALETGGY